MISIRRKLMVASGGSEPTWPSFVILTNPSGDRSNSAATVVNEAMVSAGIDRSNKMIFLKRAMASLNGQVIYKDWINSQDDSGYFFRYYNSAFSSNLWNSSSAVGRVSQGDKFIVIDPSIDAITFDKRVIVENRISRTPEAKTFFNTNVPDDGYYLAYRKFNPVDLVHYDFIAGIFSSTIQVAFKAEGNLQSVPIINWTSTSYAINLYPGDVIYFLKINL